MPGNIDSTSYLRQTLTINAAQTKQRLSKIYEKGDMISSQILRG